MPTLDEKMSSMAELVLKRCLSEDEKNEIFRISDAMGMANVQSFLHLLMVFKLHEDVTHGQFEKLASLKERFDEQFEEMSKLSRNIAETIERSIGRVLSDGAREIGRDMGVHIAEGAKEALGARDDYQSLRGQVCVVCLLSFIAAVAYRLGTINAVGSAAYSTALDSLFLLPAGWWAFSCCSLYTFMWAYDHWKLVKKSALHKGILTVQCLILAALILSIL
jgi:hypothetical protein